MILEHGVVIGSGLHFHCFKLRIRSRVESILGTVNVLYVFLNSFIIFISLLGFRA